MIKGHLDLSFITDGMLDSTEFKERNPIGFTWKELDMPEPSEPITNAVVHQSFELDCPDWAHQVKAMFSDKLTAAQVTINLVKPGQFIPPHRDAFIKLHRQAKLSNTLVDNLVPIRVNVFLQDHKLGHFFEMDGEVCMNYKKGDFAIIHQGAIHSVINIGNTNRYTLQVSGFADRNTFI